MHIYGYSETRIWESQLLLLLKWTLLLICISYQTVQYASFVLFQNIWWNSGSHFYLPLDLVLSFFFFFWQIILPSQIFHLHSFGNINSFAKTMRSLHFHKMYLLLCSFIPSFLPSFHRKLILLPKSDLHFKECKTVWDLKELKIISYWKKKAALKWTQVGRIERDKINCKVKRKHSFSESHAVALKCHNQSL